MDILIHEAVPDDMHDIREVQKQGWLTTYPHEPLGITKEDIAEKFNVSKEEHEAYIEERKKTLNANPHITHCWVAKDGERLVGFSFADKSKKHRIWAMYVLPEYKRRGIGKQLMKASLDWLGGRQDVYLNVASYNERAIKFFESFGFRITDNVPANGVADLPSGKRIPVSEMVLKIQKHRENGIS